MAARTGLVVVSLAVAVAALAVAAFALLRPTVQEPEYTAAQQESAKSTVCAAFATVRTGVATNTNLTPPGGADDVTGALATAANARVALFDGGQYLLARLDPATPEGLAADVRRFAGLLMDIGASATAGVPNSDPTQAARLTDAQTASSALDARCG